LPRRSLYFITTYRMRSRCVLLSVVVTASSAATSTAAPAAATTATAVGWRPAGRSRHGSLSWLKLRPRLLLRPWLKLRSRLPLLELRSRLELRAGLPLELWPRLGLLPLLELRSRLPLELRPLCELSARLPLDLWPGLPLLELWPGLALSELLTPLSLGTLLDLRSRLPLWALLDLRPRLSLGALLELRASLPLRPGLIISLWLSLLASLSLVCSHAVLPCGICAAVLRRCGELAIRCCLTAPRAGRSRICLPRIGEPLSIGPRSHVVPYSHACLCRSLARIKRACRVRALPARGACAQAGSHCARLGTVKLRGGSGGLASTQSRPDPECISCTESGILFARQARHLPKPGRRAPDRGAPRPAGGKPSGAAWLRLRRNSGGSAAKSASWYA